MSNFNVFDIPNYIIGFCKKNKIEDCSSQKLLLYYVYLWVLVLFERKIINNCFFDAWTHEIVASSIYEKYKAYQYDSIDYNEEYKKKKETKK